MGNIFYLRTYSSGAGLLGYPVNPEQTGYKHWMKGGWCKENPVAPNAESNCCNWCRPSPLPGWVARERRCWKRYPETGWAAWHQLLEGYALPRSDSDTTTSSYLFWDASHLIRNSCCCNFIHGNSALSICYTGALSHSALHKVIANYSPWYWWHTPIALKGNFISGASRNCNISSHINPYLSFVVQLSGSSALPETWSQ